MGALGRARRRLADAAADAAPAAVFYAYRERGQPRRLAAGAAGAVAAVALALEALGWLLGRAVVPAAHRDGVMAAASTPRASAAAAPSGGSPTCSRPPTAHARVAKIGDGGIGGERADGGDGDPDDDGRCSAAS